MDTDTNGYNHVLAVALNQAVLYITKQTTIEELLSQ
jgi:hypothetical protein